MPASERVEAAPAAVEAIKSGRRVGWASHLPDEVGRVIDRFFGPRAADVDAGRATVREGIVELARLGAFEADLPAVVAIVARVARHDLASAFSAWAHRMVVEYLTVASSSRPARRWLAELRAGRVLGATAMAAGTAHVLAGTELPVRAERVDGRFELRGRIPWASNLLPPFIVVTAAARRDDPGRAAVVVLTDDSPALRVEPYPELLALGSTGSSSISLTAVPVHDADVLALDLAAFVDRILAPFLLIQSAFCLGLAERAVEEAEAHLGPLGAPLRSELELAQARFERLVGELVTLAEAADAGAVVSRRSLLALRLEAAHLAADAVRLELVAVGGRAFVRGQPTERRLREAAFLPIQSPTEVLLRWTLSQTP